MDRSLIDAWEQIRSSQLRTVMVTTRRSDDPPATSAETDGESSDMILENELVRADQTMFEQHMVFD